MAATDATVLIYGETGTGKELVAKAIHFRSARRDHPFITINCGAIPRELLESELFGHVKGSFTGAFTHKRGKVEMADGGTVFLDEIGEMPLELQVRILRLIQEREIEKVGATTPTKVDVRIIAATHRDLAAMIKENTFREDLYYRLLVVPINLPPLRGRDGDIGELALHFFLKSRVKHGRPDLVLPHQILDCFSRVSLARQCPPIGEHHRTSGPARQASRDLGGGLAGFPPAGPPRRPASRQLRYPRGRWI